MVYLLIIGAIVYAIGEATKPVYCVSVGLPAIITQLLLVFIGMLGGAMVVVSLWENKLNKERKGEK